MASGAESWFVAVRSVQYDKVPDSLPVVMTGSVKLTVEGMNTSSGLVIVRFGFAFTVIGVVLDAKDWLALVCTQPLSVA